MSKPATRRARISLSGLSTFQKIQAWYRYGEDRVDLPAHVHTMRERWVMAYSQLREWEKKEDIASLISGHYGVSMRTAYDDIKNAELLFKKILETDWEFVRLSLLETYREALKEAKDKKKLGYIQLFGKRIEALIPKNTGHKLIDPDKIKPHTIVISADEKSLRKQVEELNKLAEEAEYTDFEEVE